MIKVQEIADWDERVFISLVSRELTSEQRKKILKPKRVCSEEHSVLAIHWHPEFVPLDLIKSRIDSMFPHCQEQLVIPTQHNVITQYGDYAGVEVDCHATEFSAKAQLLLHFKKEKLAGPQASPLKDMIKETFTYREKQMMQFLELLAEKEHADQRAKAAAKTCATEELVAFVLIHARKLMGLINKFDRDIPVEALRNKLIHDYFNELRFICDGKVIDRAQIYLNSIKQIVKSNIDLSTFYSVQDFIEETRSLGGGVVVPHPEQFWPILMTDYDVDGYEVWNPASKKYTEFIISILAKQNERKLKSEGQLLVFMGDDTHMGDKVKTQNRVVRGRELREIGVQPAWKEPKIRRILKSYGVNKKLVIEQYRERLD